MINGFTRAAVELFRHLDEVPTSRPTLSSVRLWRFSIMHALSIVWPRARKYHRWVRRRRHDPVLHVASGCNNFEDHGAVDLAKPGGQTEGPSVLRTVVGYAWVMLSFSGTPSICC